MKKFLAISIIFVSFGFLIAPTLALGSHTQPIPAFPRPYWGTSPPLLPCGPGVGHDCTSICEIFVLVQRLIYFGITLVFFAIAPILFLYGGVTLLISAGSPEKISSGKKILTGTIYGVALALGSFLIVNTFFWIIGLAVGSPLSNWSSIACKML